MPELPLANSQPQTPLKITPVVAAVIERDGRVLICQRRADQAFALQWEFPGGKVERGESLEAALMRELHEELGVGSRVCDKIATVNHEYAEGLAVELHFFRAELAGEIKNRIFHELRWELREQLNPEIFLIADRGVVTKLRTREL